MVVLWKPSEEELLQNVLAAARALGWRCYHTRDSRGSAGGFPDVVAVRPPRLIFVELKRLPETQAAGRPRADQQAWLDDLRQVENVSKWEDVHGVEVYVWRPADWLDGTIEGVLRRQGPRDAA